MTNRRANRREFLSAGLAAGAAAYSGVSFADEAKKTPAAEPLILGQGNYRYQCIHDFGTLPDNIIYGLTHGVAVGQPGIRPCPAHVEQEQPVQRPPWLYLIRTENSCARGASNSSRLPTASI